MRKKGHRKASRGRDPGILDLGGDYVGAHSAIIPLALLPRVVYSSMCRLYLTVKKKKKSKKKNHELRRSQA